MARGRRRIAHFTGWLLVGVSGVFWFLVVIGVVREPSEAASVILGALVVSVIPITAGALLVRTGRADRPVSESSFASADGLPDDDRTKLRRLRRSDRLSFWGLVAGASLAVMALAVVGIFLGLSPGAVGLLTAVLWGSAAPFFMSQRPGRARRGDPTSKSQRDRSDADGRRFSNFAFSQTLPTWHGWRRDVGDVVLDTTGVTINGLKHRIHLRAPLDAKVYEGRKYVYWTMVEVTGLSTHGEQVVVYLVAEGAPRSKFAADPEDLHRRGKKLVNEIRSAFPRCAPLPLSPDEEGLSNPHA
jgi:hypothetical protein